MKKFSLLIMDKVKECALHILFFLRNEECPDTFLHPGYYEKIYLLYAL